MNISKIKIFNYFSEFVYRKREITTTKLIIFTALFFVSFANKTFFQHVLQVYPLSWKNIGFLFSLVVGLTSTIIFLLNLVTSRYTTKVVLISVFIVTAFTAYFIDSYTVVIDHVMIQNMIETNWKETSDLLNIKILYYLFLIGVMPSLFVYKV
jgi:lipid A ethanolaminephosphotransferase